MPPELDRKDRVRLMHMMDAAQQALEFSTGRSRETLESDAMYRRAMVNCIQEIGEAAARVSEPTRALAPEIPFKSIIAMRNRIVHVYFDIDPDELWEVVQKDLQPLVQALQRVLATEH
jgi:uncharacterized protein with HEPN domain